MTNTGERLSQQRLILLCLVFSGWAHHFARPHGWITAQDVACSVEQYVRTFAHAEGGRTQLQWRRGPYRATSVDGFATAVAQQIEDAIVVGDSEGDIYEDQSVDIDDFILLQQWKETAGIQ